MSLWRKSVLLGAVAATVSMANAAVASAGDYIDFGTDQASCKIAARQANAVNDRHSYCYQTGPGQYSLYLAD